MNEHAKDCDSGCGAECSCGAAAKRIRDLEAQLTQALSMNGILETRVTARDAALEEAARVVEESGIYSWRALSDAIRALKGTPGPADSALQRLAVYWSDVEARSADAHAVYQKEAHRRGDVRHADAYADLSEATKEWDRVLVRWVHSTIRAALEGK